MHIYKTEPLQKVVGKTIRSIVFRSGRNVNPETQLFFIFEDGTYFEFYGQDINYVRSLSDGDVTKAIDYARRFSTEILIVNQQRT
jgi:hypothetical protein